MSCRTPWLVLPHLRHFTVQVETCGPDGLDLVHVGAGELRVEQLDTPDQAGIIWHERGRWTAGPLAGVHFHNAMAWRRLPDGQGIELSHLRRGPGNPTFLAQLDPGPAGTWVAAAPHLCGQDRYLARLEWDLNRLRLIWEVQSPSDPYRLTFEASRHRSQRKAP